MRGGWTCLVIVTMSFLLTQTAAAQAPPPVDYNYLRAYRHFANSRYNYRVLSSSMPGSGSATVTPYYYQSQFIELAFSRQRLMPRGYERYEVVPAYGATMATPFGFSSYYVPGHTFGSYVPYRR